jgi:transketolase N-terminal domain/subunit
LRGHGHRGENGRGAYRVFTLLGDGELAEGSNWEAAMAAAHYKLDNLTVIIDLNTLQISGRTRATCAVMNRSTKSGARSAGR